MSDYKEIGDPQIYMPRFFDYLNRSILANIAFHLALRAASFCKYWCRDCHSDCHSDSVTINVC